MSTEVRPYESGDEADVVGLAIRAWTPVFASMAEVLGDELFTRLHGEDWHQYQSAAVQATLSDRAMHTW